MSIIKSTELFTKLMTMGSSNSMLLLLESKFMKNLINVPYDFNGTEYGTVSYKYCYNNLF